MPGLVPRMHAFSRVAENVDGRDQPGHDEKNSRRIVGSCLSHSSREQASPMEQAMPTLAEADFANTVPVSKFALGRVAQTLVAQSRMAPSNVVLAQTNFGDIFAHREIPMVEIVAIIAVVLTIAIAIVLAASRLVKPFEDLDMPEFTMLPQGDATDFTRMMRGSAPFMSKLMQVFINLDHVT